MWKCIVLIIKWNVLSPVLTPLGILLGPGKPWTAWTAGLDSKWENKGIKIMLAAAFVDQSELADWRLMVKMLKEILQNNSISTSKREIRYFSFQEKSLFYDGDLFYFMNPILMRNSSMCCLYSDWCALRWPTWGDLFHLLTIRLLAFDFLTEITSASRYLFRVKIINQPLS